MPIGQVLPPQSSLAQLTLWIRKEEADMGLDTQSRRVVAGVESDRDHAIIAINSRTGYVGSATPVFEDTDNDNQWDFPAYFNNILRGRESGF